LWGSIDSLYFQLNGCVRREEGSRGSKIQPQQGLRSKNIVENGVTGLKAPAVCGVPSLASLRLGPRGGG
jgi:hypothetical protein